jgi:enediyne biosynthesis protein E4
MTARPKQKLTAPNLFCRGRPEPFPGRLAWALMLLALLWASGAVKAQTWQQRNGYRFQSLNVPATGTSGFTLLSPGETGIWFTNLLPESRALTNTLLPNGSGVAAGDIDGDGWCDLFFSGLGGRSRLYRNLGGLKFEDITERSGIICTNLDATGAVFADIDGDGDLDLIVNSLGGGTHLFFNDGKGHFTEGPKVLNQAAGGTSIGLADVDGSGRLNLYLANYRAATILDAPGTRFTMKLVNGKPEVAMINGKPLTDPEWTNRFEFRTGLDAQGRGRLAREELGEPDAYFENDGHGHFTLASWTGGKFRDEAGRPLSKPPFDWGLSVLFRDLNGDGAPDLYVCNDFGSPDRVWFGDAHGGFQAAARLALRETSFSSMGVDAADLNRDGNDDFMVVDMLSAQHRRRLTQRNSAHSEMASLSASSDRPQYTRNTLFLNRGDGTYAEIAQYAGLDATEWSWSPIFIDVDLDGYEDLLIPNGFIRDNMNLDVQNQIKQASGSMRGHPAEALALRKLFLPLTTANLAFRNNGDLRFRDESAAWGFNTAVVSQGACLADLDNDGDLDVLLNNLNAPAGIYRNETSAARIAVRLKGSGVNTRGIGSRIVVAGGPVPQSAVIVCGGRYLSSDDFEKVFAAGSLTNRLTIEVNWPGGKQSVIANVAANCLYEIDEAEATSPRISPAKPHVIPIFEDVSQRLGHKHHEDAFDDFQRQPLLPRRLSQLGPGVAWCDLDGDGREDLIIGSGKGGRLACFRNQGDGTFKNMEMAPWNTAVERDQTALVAWQGDSILVGTASYEGGSSNGTAVDLFSNVLAQPLGQVTNGGSSVGPLAVADYDADGALDLFVGSRVIPGEYPLAGGSRLFRQIAGKLVLDATNTAQLAGAGMVSGAVWSDLTGDGFPSLILACDWGPIRVFRNDHGRLSNWDAPVSVAGAGATRIPTGKGLKLSDLTGWWTGISVGDFDGDGRMDVVAANWGQNTKYERYRSNPLRLYYGDFAKDGTFGLLESYFEPEVRKYVPSSNLEIAARGLPFIAGIYPTYQSWAETDMESLMGRAPEKLNFVEAAWLETTLFLNRGDHFEVRVLPFEAQISPAFAVCVADFDGDGFEDVFLSQNFFDVDSNTSRYDAGRGLLLRGDGQGGFRAVSGQESGIRVYGEQRGAAVCDYDGDGRPDLAVGQNSDETRLFHNVAGKPGLRVQLHGSSNNPAGIGATMRLVTQGIPGSAREVHGGSGYWSQDSLVQVLSAQAVPTQLWVRWPGGKTATYDLPKEARAVTANIDGTIKQSR